MYKRQISHSELFLRPDPKTITLLPWRPQTGRVARMMCDCLLPDGTLFTGYSRSILRQQVEKARTLGLTFQIGTEYEFYLFQSDDAGDVTLHPQDCAGYMDVSPLDKGENVRREVCLMLEQMGVPAAAERIRNAMSKAIAGRAVTVDLAAQVEGARVVGCQEFGEIIGACL